MDLTNPSLWQLVYLQSFTAEFFDFLQLPIATFDTPLFNQRVIRIKVTSTQFTSSRKWAGNFSQVINAGNVLAEIKDYSIYLNQDRVIFLEPFPPFSLRFRLAKRLSQATISIFGYTES